MAGLSTKNLCISYDNRDILRDVSTHFSEGLNYLLGLNGSGKSSMLKAFVGLVKYKGDILLDSKEVSSLSPRERAKKIALLSQKLHLPFRTRVFDFVLMGRFPHLNWLGNYSLSDREAAEQALEKMRLQDLRHRSMDELSGGEFQRANLARALCQDSPVLLLDEPGQSLDPRSKAALYAMLEELAESHLLICATHDLEYVQPQARVLGLRNQGVVWDGWGKDRGEAVLEKVYGISAD